MGPLMNPNVRVDACFDDTTTRTLTAHAYIGWGQRCICGAHPITFAEHPAHVAVELRTALVAARIPEPCPTCDGTGWIEEWHPGGAGNNCPPAPDGCGGVGTIPGERLIVTHDELVNAVLHGCGDALERLATTETALVEAEQGRAHWKQRAEIAERTDLGLIVESLDPKCLMLLVEGEAGAEVEMLGDDWAPRYLGTVRLYRNENGNAMVEISDIDNPRCRTVVVHLTNVKKITVL